MPGGVGCDPGQPPPLASGPMIRVTSHSVTLQLSPELPDEASILPSELNATYTTPSVCVLRVARSWRVATSQNRTGPPQQADASVRPSGLKATEETGPS